MGDLGNDYTFNQLIAKNSMHVHILSLVVSLHILTSLGFNKEIFYHKKHL